MKIVVHGDTGLVKSAKLCLVGSDTVKLTLNLSGAVAEVIKDFPINEYSIEQFAAFNVFCYNSRHARVKLVPEYTDDSYFKYYLFYQNLTGSTYTALWVYDKNSTSKVIEICSYKQAL